MEKQRKWAGWIIAGVASVLLITILTLNQGTAVETPALPEASDIPDETIRRQLFPYAEEGSDAFEKLEIEGLEAHAVLRGGETLGYTIRHTVQGYAGPIELVVGLRPDQTLTGVYIGGSSFRETEGLGAKAKEPAFTDQFAGKTVPVELGKEIDSIAGATITSRAVVDGVNNAAAHLQPFLSPAQPDGRTANASAIGYGGPVLVRLTLDENGVISWIDVGGARFMETEGIGSRVREKAFMEQFIGKTPPLSLGEDIDAVSGATLSSEAAVRAVNDAAAFLAQE